MILDHYENIHLYYGLSKNIDDAITYFKNLDLSNLNFEKHKIEGTDIYVMVQEYMTKSMDEGKWESHKKYIDIQYIVEGVEKIGYSHLKKMAPISSYDDETDFIFYKGEGNYFDVEAGNFVLFTPQDVHKPSLLVDKSNSVKKLVFKIPVK